MARRPLAELTLPQLLERVSELEAMAATATTVPVKTALEKLASRFLALADRRAAEMSDRAPPPDEGPHATQQWPGEPALRSGRFRLLNVFGRALQETTHLERGEPIPPAPRGFTWVWEDVPVALFGACFEATPHPYLLLTPDLKIAGANDAYLAATFTRRSDIVGCPMFDAFPDNPNDLDANGVANLGHSLIHVLSEGRSHAMGIQRYDIRRPDGQFQERWWKPVNIPVFHDGRMVHVLHHVVDVTAQHRQSECAASG